MLIGSARHLNTGTALALDNGDGISVFERHHHIAIGHIVHGRGYGNELTLDDRAAGAQFDAQRYRLAIQGVVGVARRIGDPSICLNVGLTGHHRHFDVEPIAQVLGGDATLEQHVALTIGHPQGVAHFGADTQVHPRGNTVVVADLALLVGTIITGPDQ